MKKFLLTATLALVGLVQAQTTYVDVPPCHWAVEAINIVSSGDQVTPAQSAGNAQNAVRQVLEGLQCGDVGWTGKFVVGAPSAFASIVSSKLLKGYQMSFGKTTVSGNTASVAVTMTLKLVSGEVKRSGVIALSSDAKAAWKVSYASLAALNVAIFPK